MRERYDQEEWELAQQVAAQLAGEAVPDAAEEAAELSRFALALPWEGTGPADAFQQRLREKLVQPAQGGSRRTLGQRIQDLRRRRPKAFRLAAAGAFVAVALAVFLVVYYYANPVYVPVIRMGLDRSTGWLPRRRVWVTAVPEEYAAMPTMVAAATPVPAAPPDQGSAPLPSQPAPLLDRMVIKNGEIEIQVEDTDVAVDRLTGILEQYEGYVVSIRTWYADQYKEGTVVLGVPSEHFEEVLRRVRQIALRVEREAVTGQDVTEEYVDLQSRLENLQATAARVRALLEQAETVEEALQVNQELNRIQEEIELIQGRMQYLSQRAAYSTITVEVRQTYPTPTPTPTPTPAAWRPGETLEQAGDAVTSVGRFLWEAFIWIGVVVLPVVGGFVLLMWLVRWAIGLFRR